ncbi:MAG: Rrf2 family transcriptional regulator [Mariprofundaceae bacterium]|nr:Rrf2 family transcriptional regulator [Mariprofundaceae bacterium]
MRLTSKGRYAVSSMLDLYLHQEKGPVSLAKISERQFISLSYLEQLFRCLRNAELVRSVRGPGGGYLLSRDATKISIAAIIASVNEEIKTVRCAKPSVGCLQGVRCDTHQLWASLGDHIQSFLDQVTLADVAHNTDKERLSKKTEEYPLMQKI